MLQHPSVLITVRYGVPKRRGTPVVKVVPARSEKNDIFGFMTGKVKIVGDIESPIPVEWESTTK